MKNSEDLKKMQAIIQNIVAKKESRENLTQDEQAIYETYRRENKPWILKNLWWLILIPFFFIIRMCNELN